MQEKSLVLATIEGSSLVCSEMVFYHAVDLNQMDGKASQRNCTHPNFEEEIKTACPSDCYCRHPLTLISVIAAPVSLGMDFLCVDRAFDIPFEVIAAI